MLMEHKVGLMFKMSEDTETGPTSFIAATGGTVTTSGNFKIHTFTGPGTFCVSTLVMLQLTHQNNKIGYLVVAGGGGRWWKSHHGGGGGGAGGFREGINLQYNLIQQVHQDGFNAVVSVTVTAQAFPITVRRWWSYNQVVQGP